MNGENGLRQDNDDKVVRDDFYEVEEIMACRKNLRTRQTEYLVKWAGYSSIWNTWEPEEHLKTCPEALKNFFRKKQSEQSSKKPIVTKNIAVEDLYRQFSRSAPQIAIGSPIEEQAPLKFRIPGAITVSPLDRSTAYEKFILMMNLNSNAKVFVENHVDDELPPAHFQCISAPIIRHGVPEIDPSFIVGCSCDPQRVCDGEHCLCTSQNDDSRTAYTQDGRIRITSGPIYECNSKCSCPQSCGNRVVQRGRTVPLIITRYGGAKGWGVKAACEIPMGTFVDVYLGELLTSAEATKRSQSATDTEGSYLFDLDFNYEAGTESAFTIDAYNYGNITHFINHSCEPNLRVHPCFIESIDPSLHHLAFFARRHIKEGEELCFDYLGEQATKSTRTKGTRECSCGSPKCRGYVY